MTITGQPYHSIIENENPASIDVSPLPALFEYVCHLADNALILAQRNAEWTGHGPVLEQDIAMSNISLDLLGQARYLYQYAARLKGNGATEDTLAYFRDVRSFRNCLIAELNRGDWALTTLRQFLFSSYQFLLFDRLQHNKDLSLSAIAAKCLKEVRYHLRWSGEWVIRLGDGTTESHRRMQSALDLLWPYTGELFTPAPYENELAGQVPAPGELAYDWMAKVTAVCEEAFLTVPSGVFMQQGGKTGFHTEQLGFILAEMQFLQRAYPGNEW